MRVVISEFMDEAALDAFSAAWDIQYRPDLVDDRDALLAAVADADAVIVRNRTQVDAGLLAAAPKLKVVGRLGVGLDNIDLTACADKSVAVRPATGANSDAVAEYVIAASLSLTRAAYASNAQMLAGDWPRAALMGGEVAGRTIGLVGCGGIARGVARRAAALGMNVIGFDPGLPSDDLVWTSIGRKDLPDLLSHADIISLHVPLTDATRNLMDAKRIAKMKQGAILINTARGGVVDEAALADALRTEHLGGAAIDVFSSEPLDKETAAVFKDCPNLILTPHIAGVTKEANTRVSHVTVANVIEELSRA